MTQKENAPHHPKAMEGATTTSAILPTKAHPVNVLALACTTLATRGTIRTKAKALGSQDPVCRSTFGKAVCTPTDKRGFVSSKFSGMASTVLAWFRGGMGWRYSKDRALSGRTPAWLYPCFEHPAHPLCVEAQPVVLKSRKGAKTMHPVNPLGQTAPAFKATPANTTHTSTEAQAFALLKATSNASLAAFYLRKGNVAAARRKAVQLLKSLQVLEVAHV